MLKSLYGLAVGIAKGVARALRAVAKTALEMLDEIKQALVGGGARNMLAAHFEPEVKPEALLDELRQTSQRTAAIRELDRDHLRTVTQYLKTLPVSRPTVDLSGLPKDLRATLITMDENEIAALSNAGPGAIRKFIQGRDHGVHGVPIVKPFAVAKKNDETPYDLLVKGIQAGLRDPRSKAYAMPKM